MTDTAFRKYTNLPALLNILNTKKITLSDPAKWEDKNDSYFIDTYKTINNYKSVLVSCFSETKETYHHWKIYAGNQSGICIEFEKTLLLQYLSVPNVIMGRVEYKTVSWLKNDNFTIDKMPFYKRFAFIDEAEYRVLYHSVDEEIATFEIKIDFDCINKIIINPWLDKSLSGNLQNTISNYLKTNVVSVYQSTLLENEEWVGIAKGKERQYLNNDSN